MPGLTGPTESAALKAAPRRLPAAISPKQRALSTKRWRGFNDEPARGSLAALIARQHWRAGAASVAADDINYRRFFIVSDLAAIRIEREEVFDHVHALTFQLVEEGLVDGLRVDHIDGLYDPKAYCLLCVPSAPARSISSSRRSLRRTSSCGPTGMSKARPDMSSPAL